MRDESSSVRSILPNNVHAHAALHLRFLYISFNLSFSATYIHGASRFGFPSSLVRVVMLTGDRERARGEGEAGPADQPEVAHVWATRAVRTSALACLGIPLRLHVHATPASGGNYCTYAPTRLHAPIAMLSPHLTGSFLPCPCMHAPLLIIIAGIIG